MMIYGFASLTDVIGEAPSPQKPLLNYIKHISISIARVKMQP